MTNDGAERNLLKPDGRVEREVLEIGQTLESQLVHGLEHGVVKVELVQVLPPLGVRPAAGVVLEGAVAGGGGRDLGGG